MKQHHLIDIIHKLIGHISFAGETNHDNKSLENLEEYGEIVHKLVSRLVNVYLDTANVHEFSGKQLNQKTAEILISLKERLNYYWFKGETK